MTYVNVTHDQVPLQGAAAEGDLTMVEALIKAGAATSGERERDGQTPLHAAAEGGRYIHCTRSSTICAGKKWVTRKYVPVVKTLVARIFLSHNTILAFSHVTREVGKRLIRE